MPKNNKNSRKAKANHHQAANNNNNTNDPSDDEMSIDGASVYSYQSDNNITPESDSAETVDIAEKYEDKLLEAIDNASAKSQQTRVTALQLILDTFTHHSMIGVILERRMSLMDIVEKSLKRGKGKEQEIAAKLAAVLIIQLQGDEEIVKILAPVLQSTAIDKSASYEARAKSCLSLALLQFLGGQDDIGDTILLCQFFESCFSGSFLKGDKTPSTAQADAATFHAAALSSWALLITLIPPGDIVSQFATKSLHVSFENLLGMLKSQHLDVRMTAGEAIAVLLECGRAHDDEFLESYMDDLIEVTKELATDSQKFRAKRDRKQQRATFRDVLLYIEEETFSDITIQVGAGITKETLILDSWSIHHQYTSICNLLGSGMNQHLLENEFLRDVFEMGERLDESQITTKKLSKNEKRAIQAASFKARTLSRGKNRDKRSAVVN